ncbi:MAG TPA: hypothetical protein DD727_08675 [Clostridiales bacterium]|nr:hypothetical protein [Clostridiales bacterium]
MSNYLDFNNMEVWGNPMIVNQPSIRGKYYMIVRTVNGMNVGMWYNKQIFANEGLTPLPELVAQDRWTWETFLDLATISTRDFNGDGYIDQWGFAHTGLPDLSNALLFSNGSEPISEQDGVFTYTIGNDAKAYRALNFMQNLFYVYKVAPIDYGLNIFANGNAAMCSGFDWLNMGVGSGFVTHHTELALDIFPYGPENPEKKGQAKTNLNGWAAAYNMNDPDKAVRAFAEAMAVWDPGIPGYLSMEAMLQSRYQNSKLLTPDEQRAFVQGRTTSFNFVNSIPGVSGLINGALTKISNGLAPKSALDEIKQNVEQLCSEYSLQ